MRAYITTNLNQRSHVLKRRLGVSWGHAFRLACMTQDIPFEMFKHSASVFGTWGHTSSKNLAGHFWGLSKAYDEVGQRGRAIAMHKTAKTLYTLIENQTTLDLKVFMQIKGVGEATIEETLDFFNSSVKRSLTSRSQFLISKGASTYAQVVKRPAWKLEHM